VTTVVGEPAGSPDGAHPPSGSDPDARRSSLIVSLIVQVVRRPFLWLIRAYQLVVSPWMAPRCRYTPSCSAYAYQAIDRHGVVRGLVLALRRLLRCHPWAAGGPDPVPPHRLTPHPPNPPSARGA
jgi:putative membrane protein insertion efficiency factor